MKHHKNRLLALFLAVCLAFSLLPTSALAAEQDEGTLTVVPTFPGGQYTQNRFYINNDSSIQYSLSFNVTASTLDEPILVVSIPKGLTLTYYPSATDPTLVGSLAAGTPITQTAGGDGSTILSYRFRPNVASIGFNINLRPTFLLPHDREVTVEATYYNGNTLIARESSGVTCYNSTIADNYPSLSFSYNNNYYNNVVTDEYGPFISTLYVPYGPHYSYDAVRLVTAIPDGAVMGFGKNDTFVPLEPGRAYPVEDGNGGYSVTYLNDYDFKDSSGKSLGKGQALVYELTASNTYSSVKYSYYPLIANLFLRFTVPGEYNKGIGAQISVTVDGIERIKTPHMKTTSTSSTLKYTVKPYNLTDFFYVHNYFATCPYGASNSVLPLEENHYFYNTIYNKTGETLTDVSFQYRIDRQFYTGRITFSLYDNSDIYPSRAEVRYKTAKGNGIVKRATLNTYNRVLLLDDLTDAITEFTVTYDKVGTNNGNEINLCQPYAVNRDNADDGAARKISVQIVAATVPSRGNFEDVWQEHTVLTYLSSSYTGYLYRPSLSTVALNKGDEFYICVSGGSSMRVKNGAYYVIMPPEYIYVRHRAQSNLPGTYTVTSRTLPDGNVLYTIRCEDGVERNYENHFLYFRVGPTADTSVVRTETLPIGFYAENNHPHFRLNTEDSNYCITDTLDYNQNGSTTDKLSKPYDLPKATINSVSTLFTQALLLTDAADGPAINQPYRYDSQGTYRCYVFNGFESSVSPEDVTVTIAIPQEGDAFTYKGTVYTSKWGVELTGAAVPEGDFWRDASVAYSTDGGTTYGDAPSDWREVTHVKVTSQTGRILHQSESASIALPLTPHFPEGITASDKAYFTSSTGYRLTGTVSKEETAVTEPCILQTATTDISGVIFKDYNADGIQDTNEQSAGKSYTVQLYKGSTASGSVVASTASDVTSGQYRVGALLPGTYTAKVVKANDEFYNTQNTRYDAQGCYTFTIGDSESVLTGLNMGILSPRTMSLGYSSYNLKSDTPIKLSYTLSPGLLSDEKMAFSSSNETVVTVGEDGVMHYVADGTATVTLTAPQLSSVVEQGVAATISRAVTVTASYAGCRITAAPYIGKTSSTPPSGAIAEQAVPYDPRGITADFYYFYGRSGYCNNPAHTNSQTVKWEITDDGGTSAKLSAVGNKVTLTASHAGTVILRAVEDWPHDADRKPAPKTVALTITRQTVKKPMLNGTCTYNSLPQKVAITSGDLYTIVGDMATDAGNYTATVALKSPQDYLWADGTDTPLTIDWSIAKAMVTPPIAGPAATYTGAEQTAPIAENPLYLVSDNKATDAGLHTATVMLRDSGNYTWVNGSTTPVTVEWEICKAKVDKPTVSADFTYTGEEQTAPIPESILYSVSGNTATTAGSYTAKVALNDPENYEWADGSTDVLTFDWKIGVLSIPMPAPEYALVYDGTEQSCGLEDSEYYTVTGHTATDAGRYTAQTMLRDGTNYQWSDGSTAPLVFTWEIRPASVPMPTVDCSLTYDGTEQSCGLEDTNQYSVMGHTATDAGAYTATATLRDSANYIWSDGSADPLTFAWDIAVAFVPKPMVGSNLIYDGSEQSCGLNSTELYALTGNTAAKAGRYTAVVELHDSRNYHWEDGSTEALELPWHIAPKPLTEEMISCAAKKVYTGQPITLEDADFTVSDGDALTQEDWELDGYAENTAVSMATFTIRAREDGNYTGTVQAQFTIVPRPCTGGDFTIGEIPGQPYTGDEITPKPTVLWGEQQLTEGTDYTLAYENNIQPGTDTALVKIAFIGNFEGTVTAPFSIYAYSGGQPPKKPVEPEEPEPIGVPYYMENSTKVFIGFSLGEKYLAPRDVAVQFAGNPKTFEDITGHWGEEAIRFVAEREVFLGMGKDRFSPDTGMTRAMFAAVMGRLYEKSFGSLVTADAAPFADVPAQSWYGKYAAWIAEQGVMVGVGGGKFAPERSITRAEMAVTFHRFTQLMHIASIGVEEKEFRDASLIPAWAREAVDDCTSRGFMVGRGDNLFAPNATATRAEVSTILQRYITAIVG
jgi:hypothetical protein